MPARLRTAATATGAMAPSSGARAGSADSASDSASESDSFGNTSSVRTASENAPKPSATIISERAPSDHEGRYRPPWAASKPVMLTFRRFTTNPRTANSAPA